MADINNYAYDLLLAFHDACFSEIKRILIEEFGDQWISSGVRRHFRPDYFDRVEKVIRSPLRVVNVDRSDEEMYGVEHLWNIIDGNWRLFRGSLHDRPRTESYLSEITELRNYLAHRRKSHVILRTDLIRPVGSCQRILSALSSPADERFSDAVESLSSGSTPWGPSLDGNLPPSDEMYSEFVGRPSELHGLSEWLSTDRRQVLVWGYGGAGKSALAYKFACDVRDSAPEELMAVCWVTAKQTEFVQGVKKDRHADFTDIESLIGSIWTALNGPGEMPADYGRGELVEELSVLPVLLIVDDFDTVSADELLSEFLLYDLRNTAARIIYTSRQQLPGMKKLEVPPFSGDELHDFIALRAAEYGARQDECLRRATGIASVTEGYPLFVDDLIRHASIFGIEEAMKNWSQKKGDAAREYALRRQVQYLGQNCAEVLMALSIANRGLLPVEISNIAGLTDGDVEAGLAQLLDWQMVNRAVVDEYDSPVYRMSANTSRLVGQTFRGDYRLRTYSAAFKSLTGERVPEAKRQAIGKVIHVSRELARTKSFEEARDYLFESMTGELADSPDLYGVLGLLHSRQRPLDVHIEHAREAFERSQRLGSSKTDTYYHWVMMEKQIAEFMISRVQHEGMYQSNVDAERAIADQWGRCEQICRDGLARCGPSQVLFYWAGYSASREAKARERAMNFHFGQGAYARAIDWFKLALEAPVSDLVHINKSAIHRGLSISYDAIGDDDGVRNAMRDWLRTGGRGVSFDFEWRRLLGRHPSLEQAFVTEAVL